MQCETRRPLRLDGVWTALIHGRLNGQFHCKDDGSTNARTQEEMKGDCTQPHRVLPQGCPHSARVHTLLSRSWALGLAQPVSWTAGFRWSRTTGQHWRPGEGRPSASLPEFQLPTFQPPGPHRARVQSCTYTIGEPLNFATFYRAAGTVPCGLLWRMAKRTCPGRWVWVALSRRPALPNPSLTPGPPGRSCDSPGSGLVDLAWGPRVFILSKCPGDTDAAGPHIPSLPTTETYRLSLTELKASPHLQG